MMVARTYYPDPEPTFAHPCRLHGCADRMHGYTLDDIQRSVRVAMYAHAPLAMDRALLHEAAWDGVVECLTEATGHPTPGELTAAGLRALSRAWKQEVHHHGYRPGGDYREDGSGMRGANFLTYWRDQAGPTDPMDSRVVEPLAVAQVLATLPESAGRTFALLAAVRHDVHAAATVAGATVAAFRKRLLKHRGAFLAVWHDDETPRRTARSRLDRRRVDRAPCGTPGGYAAHRYRKESTCEPCRAVMRERPKAKYAAGKATPTAA